MLHSSHVSTLPQHLFVCRRVEDVHRGMDLLHLLVLCSALCAYVYMCVDNIFDNDGLVALAWGLSGNTSLHSITLGSTCPCGSCGAGFIVRS